MQEVADELLKASPSRRSASATLAHTSVDESLLRLAAPCRGRSCAMAKVVAIMSMSLDGYVADANDGVAEVFDWYFSGDVEVSTASTRSA